jgi:hypothetical protein
MASDIAKYIYIKADQILETLSVHYVVNLECKHWED